MITFSHDPRVAEQQMHAVIYYLTAFGYIDGDFDTNEKQYIRDHIGKLVEMRASGAFDDDEVAAKRDVVTRWTKHFHEVLDEIDGSIRSHFSESVAEGEDTRQFVLAKLKLRCFEIFRQLDEGNRASLLGAVDELMMADGVVHPNERRFRDELGALLAAPVELDEAEIETLDEGAVVVTEPRPMVLKQDNHPFFAQFEWDYAADAGTVAQQTQRDMQLVDRMVARLGEQRRAGAGKLAGRQDVSEFAGEKPFLDGHVYVHPTEPGRDYELLVLGDLHGCYTCLKAALLQADFFAKVQAHHDDPTKPDMKLVLLGDYIDRGRYSYNGVLRTVMQLFLTVPDHVYALRGNHEYYIEHNGRVYGGVRPAEAINSLQTLAPREVFVKYMNFFEQLPNMLLFDRTIFVHAGIPRDDTLASKWTGLESLNDSEIRFQMLWSDPSEAEFIPLELQRSNARFPFGRRQFKSFLSRVGCTTMVRGHERVVEGFRKVYDDDDGRLFIVFSAGGATNQDLPANSNYREVRPMALSVRHRDGITQYTPFAIDYARFNDPRTNAFFRERLASAP